MKRSGAKASRARAASAGQVGDLAYNTDLASMPRRAWQWDLARQVERLEWLEAQIPRYADWGYQELYLHLEDAVDYPSLPGVARRDAYSHRQLGRLVDCAGRAGIGVVPIVNLLGHTQYLIKVPDLRDLNECRAPDGTALERGQICPVHPRTMEIAGRLLRDVAPFCTAGRVHVGLDESYLLGRHPLSRAEIAAAGLAAHFARYVHRLNTVASGLGLRMGLWADVLALLPEAIEMLPGEVAAYDWYYYPFARLPRIELHNFVEYDLARALRSRGIEYWGCPMSGAFRHEPLPIAGDRLANIAAWWRRCRRVGAAGILVTSWEPQRLAAEIPLAIDAAAAGLWLDGEEDPERLLELGCRRAFGALGRIAARRLRSADRRPFSGYVRWRLNERWDGAVADDALSPWRRETLDCEALAAGGALPPALAASLRFRAYLAERDLFVREAGQAVWRLRRMVARGDRSAASRLCAELQKEAAGFSLSLRRGASAARAMWRRTRAVSPAGPNEVMLKDDSARLRAWRAWLARARRDPGHSREHAPVAGSWQFLFSARNFAPALQKVVVERRNPAGGWETLQGLFLVEFRSRAARPRARLVYRLSVPIEWRGPPARPPHLRIGVRGYGRLEVSDAVLTDGVQRFATRFDQPDRSVVGEPAPLAGFPDFDWERNRGTWEPELAVE